MRQKFRELGRLSRAAFWVVITSAVLGLVTILLHRTYAPRTWSTIGDVLDMVMFAGLVVLIIATRSDRRRTTPPHP